MSGRARLSGPQLSSWGKTGVGGGSWLTPARASGQVDGHLGHNAQFFLLAPVADKEMATCCPCVDSSHKSIGK